MEKYELAEKDYNDGMKYREIAEKYEVSLNTVKSWKKRYNWFRDRGAPHLKSVHTKKRGGASNGNKHAKGNKGGAAPKGNQNARTHGLFAKYFNDEANEIIETLQEQEPSNLLWHQIEIQYAAIIRAQKIMWVENAKDETCVKTQEGFGEIGADKYEYQFAWDKQANFLNAQSRAMTTLSNLIKQFINITNEDDERMAKLKQILAATDNIKARTELIKGAEKDTSILNALIDVVNGGDGSGTAEIQPETTRNNSTKND